MSRSWWQEALHRAAMFLGVAELSSDERKDFVDSWLTRAQKMHDDDLLLSRWKKKPTIVDDPKVTPSTAEQRRRLELDVPDGEVLEALEGEDPEKTAMPRVVVTLNHWKVLRNLVMATRRPTATSMATMSSTATGAAGPVSEDQVDFIRRTEVKPVKDQFKLKQYEMHTTSLKPGPLFLETKWASFTWWVTIVQLICAIVTISIYGVATIGGFTTTIRDEVLTSSLSVEDVSYEEDSNIWIGPRLADLIHIGARFTPCMRDDANVRQALMDARDLERGSACCVRNDGSGCLQTTEKGCSDILATWLKWPNETQGPDNRLSGSVCGQDPRFCRTPQSVGAFTWKDDVTEWPICTESMNVSSRRLDLRHVTCPLAGRPCCIGTQGQCVITTREYCEFRRGFFHPDATLCSQVSCLSEICGMIPFYNPQKPDQFYRFWISLFLHFGILHMVFTLIIQLVIMRRLEKMLGWLRIILIYTVCGMAANVFSGIFLPYFVTVGPTGSQAGILATFFLETLANRRRHDYWRWASICLAIFFVLLLVIGLFVPMIDNYAILVGTVLGLPLGFALMPFVGYDRDNKNADHFRKIGVIVSLVGVACVFAVLLIVFYLAPLYTCPKCHYFNCIPITPTYCHSSELRIIPVHDY